MNPTLWEGEYEPYTGGPDGKKTGFGMVQYGARTEDANSSPINAIGKSLTMQTSETKHKVKETNGKAFEFDVNISTNSDGSGSAGVSGGDESDTEYEEVTLDAKSATQSEGFNYLFTGDRINGDDESVSSFNPTDAADKAIELWKTHNAGGHFNHKIGQTLAMRERGEEAAPFLSEVLPRR